MVLGFILVALGLPFAVANWYSPFSEAISGRHSSLVPPVGGLLIGAGIYSVSESWWWTLLAIPADFGLLMVLVASPWFVHEAWSRSRFTLIGEFNAWDRGNRTILRLYRNSGAELVFNIGANRYRFNGSSVSTDDGYQITFNELVCQLVREGDGLVVERVDRLNTAGCSPALEGLIFKQHTSGQSKRR